MARSYKTKSFKLPSSLELDMNKKVVADGYGLRGKSRWLCDAITKFLTFSDNEFILDCIEYADNLENLEKSVSFRPTEEVRELLSEWAICARKKMPMLEGVISKIIRAAIIQALLGSIDTIKDLGKIDESSLAQNANG